MRCALPKTASGWLAPLCVYASAKHSLATTATRTYVCTHQPTVTDRLARELVFSGPGNRRRYVVRERVWYARARTRLLLYSTHTDAFTWRLTWRAAHSSRSDLLRSETGALSAATCLVDGRRQNRRANAICVCFSELQNDRGDRLTN